MKQKALGDNFFDGPPHADYGGCGNLFLTVSVLSRFSRFFRMGSFGEDLRMERISRGIALEHISSVTKISQHHLVALEQNRFRNLPGGILNKGIVRGYTGAIGLDQHDWTERFLKAYVDAGQTIEDGNGWTAFAVNVGRARMERHDARELRMRWIGAVVLLLAVTVAGFFTVRYFGVRAGWWPTLLPAQKATSTPHSGQAWVGSRLNAG
jgi:cytoskeleton protein RodZ